MSKENGTALVDARVKATGEHVVIPEHVARLNPDAYEVAAPAETQAQALDRAAEVLAEAGRIPIEKAREVVHQAAEEFGQTPTADTDDGQAFGPGVVVVHATPPVQVTSPPRRSAKHADWVEYATLRGVDYVAAKDMSRDELADLYLNPDSPNYTPAAADESDEPDPADDGQPASTDQEVTP